MSKAFDDIFNEGNKVQVNHDGEIFKFKDFTTGCKFAGTYIGNHIWQADDGPVVAHDFAAVTIDGKAEDKNAVFTINEFAALKKVTDNIDFGQIVGIRYNGRAERKGNPHDITPFIDTNDKDENWKTYAGVSIENINGKKVDNDLSPALESAEDEEEVRIEDAFNDEDKKVDDQPFKTVPEVKKAITDLVGKKYKMETEADIKVKVIEDSELPFNDNLENLEEILNRLTEKYAK